MDQSLDRVSSARAEILRYLHRHPNACDFLAGIDRRWLAGLEVSGQLQRRDLPDRSIVYAAGSTPKT